MKVRIALVIALMVMPQLAFADDSSSQAQAPQSAVGASDLLPQTGDSNGVSSTGAGTALQPGASSLQGSTTDGGGLSAPADQTLQAGGTSDGLKVLIGSDADGAPKTLSDSSSQFGEDLAAAATGVLLLCGVVGYLRRQVVLTELKV